MRTQIERRPIGRSMVLLVSLAACSGGEQKPEPNPANQNPAVDAGLQRYREPFQQPRTIVADELEIVISPNFFDSAIGLPGINRQVHDATRETTASGTEYRWVNLQGGTQIPLKLVIGRQGFTILKEARLKVLAGNGPVTFRVTAGGGVQIVEGSQTRTVNELRIEDGVVRVP
jgi:hypothetical protein